MEQTRAEIEASQLQKFRALVHHAQARAPYYARIIRERGIEVGSCVPGDFPILTKSLLMANFNDIVTDRRVTNHAISEFLSRSSDPQERLFDELTVTHTSGTSGEVGFFVYSPADYRRLRAAAVRDRRAFRGLFPGLRFGLRRIRLAFYGAAGGHFAGVSGIASMQRGLGRIFINARAFEINSPLPDAVHALNEFQPDVLWGYTTALKMLADEQRAGRLKISPKSVIATGETVTKADAQILSSAFGGASIVSMYACTEHMLLGMSDAHAECMTLLDDNVIFEFFEDHSVITNLFNFTLPLIRYRMSDILRPVSAPAAPRISIQNLVGRAERLPLFVNAAGATDFISPHTINEIFVAGVRRFQLQITGAASFRFPICVESDLDEAQRAAAVAGVKARLAEILAQKGLSNVEFAVPIVTDIPLNQRTRKFQLIVNQIPD